MNDDATFADFVRDRSPALYRYGYVLTGNAHDADDLVQEALIRLRGAWKRVRRTDDPIGYVRTTMARLHISTWRRRRREHLTHDVPDTGRDDPRLAEVETEVARGSAETVWHLMATLPPRQRAVLVLRFYEHLSDAEIATTLGISSGTVRSQASRALEKLRASATSNLLQGVIA